MAKDKSLSKEERKAARKADKTAAKAEKKTNGSAASGLVEDAGVKKSKSDKAGAGLKEKKDKGKRKAVAEKALSEIESKEDKKKAIKDEEDEEDDDEEEEEEDADVTMNGNGDVSDNEEKKTKKVLAERPVGALVPFANPLADEKVAKKVFKGVKKAAAQRTLKRGVKEVVKALRKSPAGTTSTSSSLPIGIVILAADISPMDVISHIPVLAEDHSIPYIYVTSRAELGMAGQTKRPTSVVMISREVGKKGKDSEKEADGESWEETFKGLVKVVEREGRHVKI